MFRIEMAPKDEDSLFRLYDSKKCYPKGKESEDREEIKRIYNLRDITKELNWISEKADLNK